jgi:hypothetical protein
MVVFGHGSLSFEDLDGDSVLVVCGSGKDLRLLGWDDGVAGDQLGHDASDGLNAHGQWVDIQKNNLTGVLRNMHTGLTSFCIRIKYKLAINILVLINKYVSNKNSF